MGANVFANGLEVSGKASDNKVVGSMPDVCLSPPSPPAGPIPIPYPNFSKASDTTNGSKKVKVGGKEVGLKDKSKYKKSNGDEAATNSFGAGVISHKITGAVKHKAGSFDVKIEGSNVVRFLDITTGNHMNPGNGCLNPDVAAAAMGRITEADCQTMKEDNKNKREEVNHNKETSTVSSATVSPPEGDPSTAWSCSRKIAGKYKNGAYKGGLERFDTGEKTSRGHKISDVKDKKGGKGAEASNLCGEAREKFKYKKTKSTSRPHTSHTEARVVESLFAEGPPPRGTVIAFSINWNDKKDPEDVNDNPCKQCHELLCAAQHCGVVVAICDGDDDKPKSLEEKTGKKCK